MPPLHRLWPALLAGIALLLAAMPPAAAQRERILSFDSAITVQSDGRLRVVETIEVEAAGLEIRRGIFRDFPTRSLTGWGFNRIAGFEVLGIERDGKPEPYFIQELNAGQRIYIGDRNVMLPYGRHRYAITYETSRQLFHRPEQDELYWNVTGDAWAFPIDRASVTARLPDGAALAGIDAYTGPRGAQGDDFEILSRSPDRLAIATTRPLAPGEGFTIAASWPAGLVDRESPWQEFWYWAADNTGVALGGVLLLALIGYFGVAWFRVGRDPAKGTIVPLFEAPNGLSPIAVGYIWNAGFGSGFETGKALSVALTSLATKRVILLGDEGGGKFSAWKQHAPEHPLPPGEQAVFDAMFGGGEDDITFGGKFSERMGKAKEGLLQAFGSEYGLAYFRGNRGLWALGALLALATVLVSLTADAMGEDATVEAAVLAVFAAAFATPALAVAGNLASRWLGSAPSPFASIFGGGISLLIIGVCALPAVGVGLLIGQMVPPAALVIAGAAIVVTVMFWHLLTAPTRLGQETRDGIEGYRLYLSVAEGDRLNTAGREPEITEALYEAHLPYAMALGVERQWTDRLMARLAVRDAATGGSVRYAPAWLVTGDGQPAPLDGLSKTLGRSLGGAAVHAATRPSSSGGSSGGFSSGGGSSGGGGGGGGGGGW
ncbi:DUF2207 domain-containing protein [Thalassobaculum sp.]|uniref:DUF2207 domain-containing protein n=1 Tax=Thalassobaculum sp. TaxID=2022740 RepID=UPI0032ED603A